jgi:hypothetical protein
MSSRENRNGRVEIVSDEAEVFFESAVACLSGQSEVSVSKLKMDERGWIDDTTHALLLRSK